MQPQIGVITNPNSRKNRGAGGGRRQSLEHLVGGHGLVRETTGAEEIRPALEEFRERGVRYWVGDGGDGTLHCMVNAGRDLFDLGVNRGPDAPVLVPTNGGTIDFVAKKAGIVGSADHILRALVDFVDRGETPPLVELDTMELLGRTPSDPEGEMPLSRICFGGAMGGIGQRSFVRYYDEPVGGNDVIARLMLRGVAGFLGYIPGVGAIGPIKRWNQLTRYVLERTHARVVIDGEELDEQHFRGLHAGAFDIEISPVKLFRYAEEPGKLHFVAGDIDAKVAPFYVPFLLFGKPVNRKGWHEKAGRSMQVWAKGDTLLDPVFDGEFYYGLEQVELRPGPRVLVPRIG